MSSIKHAAATTVEMRDGFASELSPDDFTADKPFHSAEFTAFDQPRPNAQLIDGVSLTSLGANADARGHLIELYSQRSGLAPRLHVYQVFAAPGSIRAWVYHRSQTDFLSFTAGEFQIALLDIRRESPTYGRLNVLRLGASQPTLLSIPPCVVHGVCNVGAHLASFVNMPDAVWSSEAPDKYRLRYPDRRLPFVFG